MKSDIEIAQEAKMKPIAEIAASLGLAEEDVIPYGRYKAKINHRLIHKATKQGKMILVTAISPTPAGEGKTTTSVGLADAMNALGKKTMLCLREPSLGPVFGIKGGAAGGGYAQVVPMEDINLHFTGDLHAIGTANNLLAAMIDNSIQQGNPLNIDPRRITWKRCMDMNDRQLRFIVDGLGGKVNGTPREDGFDITVASEVMAETITMDRIRSTVVLDILGSTLEPIHKDRKDFLIMLSDGQYTFDLTRANEGQGMGLDISTNYYGSKSFTEMFHSRFGDQKIFVQNGLVCAVFTSGITMLTNKVTDTADTLDYEVLRKRIFLIFHWLEKIL